MPLRFKKLFLLLSFTVLVQLGAQLESANALATVQDEPSTVTEESAEKKSSKKKDDSEDKTPIQGLTFSNPIEVKWRINAIVKTGSGTAHTMFITMPIPTAWPEQSVSIIQEDVPANIANVSYRNLESGVRQLIASVPQVPPGDEFTISLTFAVSTSQITAPPDTTIFIRPKSNHRDGKSYLGVGPQINFRNSNLRKQVKAIVDGKETPWEEVEAISDWVRENIEEDPDGKPQDSLITFKGKKGCQEDKVGLFVAMCRANKIPSRMVWVLGYQYAEFMLIDENKDAHWFPVSVNGLREFGSLAEPRIILQKGDSIRVPEKKSRQKHVGEFGTCQGKSRPSIRFHRELIEND